MDKYYKLDEVNRDFGGLSEEDIYVLRCLLIGRPLVKFSKLNKEQIAILKQWYKVNFYRSGRWNKKRITEYLKATKSKKQPIIDVFKHLHKSNCTNDLFVKYCSEYSPFEKSPKLKLTPDGLEELLYKLTELKARGDLSNSNEEIAKIISKNIDSGSSLKVATIKNKLANI